ncbi:Na+-translocating decarboxylase subunit beta [Candidatus Bathyarchaeota archaeon]|nr:MAG: Na+-translocating decarboxylase subunit beta [Candidatus Bathyarchaeota archaeon]
MVGGTITILDVFQGLTIFLKTDLTFSVVRVFLIVLGCSLVYLGYKGKLEPILMIPMGLGMAFVNAGILPMPGGTIGNLFTNPLAEEPADIINALQIYFLQPFYTLTFANGLIACLIFLGIGALTDLDFFIAKPMLSIALAIPAELGTMLTLPLAIALGFNFKEAAAIAIIGGADGPMVLFSSIMLAKHLFVVITLVAYLYLSIIYAIYPYMAKLLIPKNMRAIPMQPSEIPRVSSREKFAFAIVAGTILCLLFPVAAPLFACFFFGVAIKEANIPRYREFTDILLSGSTMFLGFVLGALLSVDIVLDPRVFLIIILGLLALLFSGVGGIIGGLVAYKLSGGKINPLLGIAGVSCVPTTAKIAQKCAKEVNPEAMILPHAMGPCVAGVITTAILAAFYITIVPLL